MMTLIRSRDGDPRPTNYVFDRLMAPSLASRRERFRCHPVTEAKEHGLVNEVLIKIRPALASLHEPRHVGRDRSVDFEDELPKQVRFRRSGTWKANRSRAERKA